MTDATPSADELRSRWADDEALVLVSRDGVVERVWGVAAAWLGDQVLGRGVGEVVEGPRVSVEMLSAYVESGAPPDGLRPRLPDGRCVALAVARCREGWLLRMRDVTADAVLAEARAHEERMHALAGLAGAVARELNDPMSIVQGRMELLLALGEPDPDAVRRHLQVALEHARRISATLRNLRVVGQRQSLDLSAVTVAAAVDDAMGLLGPRRERVRVELDPADLAVGGELALYVRVFANALRQVVEGVARGQVSFRAAREGPRVVVRVDVGRRGRSEPLEGADITIDETLLHTVGGTIEARRVGGAPAFVIGLPLPPAVRGRARPVEATMLVVGSQAFTDAVGRLLDKDGYRFVCADRAEDALERLDAEAGLAGLVTELLLPGAISGLALCLTAVHRRPELRERVVVVTEAPVTALPDPIVALSKPLSRASLLDALGRRVRRA